MSSTKNDADKADASSPSTLSADQKHAVMQQERAALTQFFQAALRGDFATFQREVIRYCELHGDEQWSPAAVVLQCKDGQGRTALHFACSSSVSTPSQEILSDNEGIVEQMLKWLLSSSDSSSSITGGHLHEEKVQRLLRIKDKQGGLTPLMVAASLVDPVIQQRRIQTLLRFGTPSFMPTSSTSWHTKLALARSKAGATALHYAAGSGVATATTVRTLYQAGKVALSAFSLQGGTPLHWACGASAATTAATSQNIMDNCVAIIALLECGADWNACNPSAGIPPPLVVAVAAGQDSHGATLLEFVLQKNTHQSTPEVASATNQTMTTRNLMDDTWQYRVMPNQVQVFHMAAELGMTQTMRALIALTIAEQANQTQTVNELPLWWTQLRDNQERATPLELAAREKHVAVVQLLLPLQQMSMTQLLNVLSNNLDVAAVPMATLQEAQSFIDEQVNEHQNVPQNNERQRSSHDNRQAILESSSPPFDSQQESSMCDKGDENDIEERAKMQAAALLAAPNLSKQQQEEALQYKSQGNAHFAKHEWHAAIQAYTMAIEKDPIDATLYSNRSACWMQLYTDSSSNGTNMATISADNQSDADFSSSQEDADANVNQQQQQQQHQQQQQQQTGRNGNDHHDPVQQALFDAVMARQLRPDWSKGAWRLAMARKAMGRMEDAAIAAWEGVQIDPDNTELKKLLQQCVQQGRQQHIQAKQKMKQDKQKKVGNNKSNTLGH